MAKQVMKAVGLDGEVVLLTDRVVINRPGWWNAILFKFDTHREIPFSSISEIKYNACIMILPGRIDFLMTGGTVVIGKKKGRGNSPTAVKFNKKQEKEFAALKEKTFELMSQHHRQ